MSQYLGTLTAGAALELSGPWGTHEYLGRGRFRSAGVVRSCTRLGRSARSWTSTRAQLDSADTAGFTVVKSTARTAPRGGRARRAKKSYIGAQSLQSAPGSSEWSHQWPTPGCSW